MAPGGKRPSGFHPVRVASPEGVHARSISSTGAADASVGPCDPYGGKPGTPKMRRAGRDRVLSATAVLAVVGIVVSVGPSQGDLYNYIAAAWTWLHVDELELLSGLTDYRWFADQAARAGLGDRLVGYTIITPPSLLIGAPLVAIGVEHAPRIWQLAQGLMLLLSGMATARCLRRPLWFGLLPFLLLAPAVSSHLWQGQLHLPAVLALSCGAWAWRAGHTGLAGLLLALAVGLKVHAWPALALLGLWRAWRALGAGACTLMLGGAVSVALLGWPVHSAWLAEGVPAGASGMFIDPWHPGFQSLGHGLRRALVPHPTLNPIDGPSLPGLAGGLSAAVQGLVVGLSLATGLGLGRNEGMQASSERQRSLAVCSVAALLSGPILTGYHLVLLGPPLAWSMDALWRSGQRRRVALIALLAAAVAAVPPLPALPALVSVPRAWLALGLWLAMMPRLRGGWRSLLVVCGVGFWMGGSGARRAADWDVVADGGVAVEHANAPLIRAELRQTADGVLWWSAILSDRGDVPGRGWVGMRWDPDGGRAASVVASHATKHVWSPTPTSPDAVAWIEGPAEPAESGCAFPDGRTVEVRSEGGAADLWLVQSDGGAAHLTTHPGHDTSPVCDARRSRVWFLSDRRVGTRALRLWWVAIP